MQGLADGYFVLPYTIGDYLAQTPYDKIPTTHEAFVQAEKETKEKIDKLLSVKGNKTVDDFHKELGKIMWEYCGMSRSAEGLTKAKGLIAELKKEFWKDVKVIGTNEELNLTLEKANRVADFIELGELMIDDALMRSESCGGHFRVESQTPEGEALRIDDAFSFTAAWQFNGEGQQETMNKEELVFENIKLTQRSYK
jgi:succinate dehydrogenase / fumarate reductase flavoprotein subunit